MEKEVGRWIATFHEFPTDMVETLMLLDETDKWEELGEQNAEGRVPMYGFMWSFSESLDRTWGESEEGKRALLQCGFRVYRSERFGIFFGIDSAGYDFTKAFWAPLYQLRFSNIGGMNCFS